MTERYRPLVVTPRRGRNGSKLVAEASWWPTGGRGCRWGVATDGIHETTCCFLARLRDPYRAHVNHGT